MLAGFALAAGLAPGAAPAAELEERTLSRSSPRVAWQGSSFNAAGRCSVFETAGMTYCDKLRLRVVAPDRSRVVIDIEGSGARDNFDMFVYWPAGASSQEVIGQMERQTGHERIVFTHTARRAARPYEILVRPTLVAPGSTYRGTAALQSAPQLEAIRGGTYSSLNVSPIGTFGYNNGSDLDFQGNFVYAGEYDAGVHIVDVSGRKPRHVALVPCSGYQNDVAVVRPGLLALGYHFSSCGSSRVQEGVRLIDVRNPRAARLLGSVEFPGGAHTITAYPGLPLVYASPGGSDPYYAYVDENNSPVLEEADADEDIIDVSDPLRPRIVKSFAPNAYGCHDVSFHVTTSRKLGFCAGTYETLVWDVSDPLNPRTIATIRNGASFHHSAVASPDGRVLVIGDENSLAHECVSGGPGGGLWIYDISNPEQPVLASVHGPRRGELPAVVAAAGTAWCTAHNYNFIPGTRMLVAAWYAGGTSVVDLANPSTPEEVAFFLPERAEAWSSYWYRGRIYVNDISRGLDVIELTGVRSNG